MTVKELKKELEKYPDDMYVFMDFMKSKPLVSVPSEPEKPQGLVSGVESGHNFKQIDINISDAESKKLNELPIEVLI